MRNIKRYNTHTPIKFTNVRESSIELFPEFAKGEGFYIDFDGEHHYVQHSETGNTLYCDDDEFEPLFIEGGLYEVVTEGKDCNHWFHAGETVTYEKEMRFSNGKIYQHLTSEDVLFVGYETPSEEQEGEYFILNLDYEKPPTKVFTSYKQARFIARKMSEENPEDTFYVVKGMCKYHTPKPKTHKVEL